MVAVGELDFSRSIWPFLKEFMGSFSAVVPNRVSQNWASA